MSRTIEQNEALRAATREAVLTAAVRVFARHGFATSGIRDIAAEAGLSTGSIYRHYATKHDLFDELLGQATTGLVTATARFRGPGEPLDLINAFTADYLKDLASDDGAAEFFKVIDQGFTTDTPTGTAGRLMEVRRDLWRAFAVLVRRGQDNGQFAGGDADQMTACYFAMLSGLTTFRLSPPDELTVPGIDSVLRALKGGNDHG